MAVNLPVKDECLRIKVSNRKTGEYCVDSSIDSLSKIDNVLDVVPCHEESRSQEFHIERYEDICPTIDSFKSSISITLGVKVNAHIKGFLGGRVNLDFEKNTETRNFEWNLKLINGTSNEF